MSEINFNFDSANDISKILNSIGTAISTTASTVKNIDPTYFESYSKDTGARIDSFQEDVNGAANDMEAVSNEFAAIIEIYRKAQEASKALVEGLEKIDPTTLNNQNVEEQVEREVLEFNIYNSGEGEEVVELTKEELDISFTKNGATKEGDVYTFTKDGNTYGYNTSTNQLTINGETVDYFCKFFKTSDTNVDDITNTITILSGRDSLNTNHGPTGNVNNELFSGVNANDNSLIIIPYGADQRYQKGAMAPCVRASTLIGDFISGKNESNSLVGYSYGGMVGYATISQNPGLYNTFVHVNTYCPDDKNYIQNLNYDAFKDVKMIILEADSESGNIDYLEGTVRTVKKMIDNGVPAENFEVYSRGYVCSRLEKILPEGRVHNVSKNEDIMNTKNWYDHSRGINIVKTCDILTYLSRDRGKYV